MCGMANVKINIAMTDEDEERIRGLAKREGRSLAGLFRYAVMCYLRDTEQDSSE